MNIKHYLDKENIYLSYYGAGVLTPATLYHRIEFCRNYDPKKLKNTFNYINNYENTKFYLYDDYLISEKNKVNIPFEYGYIGVNPLGAKISLPNFYHCLIGGRSGSGKSVALKNIIHNLVYKYEGRMAIGCIDLKGGVELRQFSNQVAITEEGAIRLLTHAKDVMMSRYDGRVPIDEPIYIFIDELAELTCGRCQKQAKELLRSLTQLGRACDIHIVAATQIPLAKVVPTEIRTNFDCRIALKTSTAGESRVILNTGEAFELFGKGSAYIMADEFPAPKRIYFSYVKDRPLQNYVNRWDKPTFGEQLTNALAMMGGMKAIKKFIKW